jgi:hypothetical protein
VLEIGDVLLLDIFKTSSHFGARLALNSPFSHLSFPSAEIRFQACATMSSFFFLRTRKFHSLKSDKNPLDIHGQEIET